MDAKTAKRYVEVLERVIEDLEVSADLTCSDEVEHAYLSDIKEVQDIMQYFYDLQHSLGKGE